ncbi:DUF3592 domain-containing protein [Algivirga pacifica]|uniref:DUF3592 domain-containing protein n=1 Tax=Algivirga pacifica TaxID=1162670 RepID=UPI003CD0BDB2
MTTLITNALTLSILVFGLVSLFKGTSSFMKGVSSKSWLPINATISDVKSKKSIQATDGEILVSNNLKSCIQYRYQMGNHFEYGSFVIEYVANNYHKGDVIKVYYNPERPSESMVYRGVQTKCIEQISLGVVLLCACLYFLIF